MEAKHAKTEVITVNIDELEYYKERNQSLARENLALKEKLEKKDEAYGMGKGVFEEHIKHLQEENARLSHENARLQQALIREAIRDV